MCAIFGFIARKDDSPGPSLKTLERIVQSNVCRGPHAFGLAWVDPRGRLKMYKQTGRVTDDLGVLAIARDARLLVGHLRYATHGDASNNLNNHPHPADGGWIVHNGVVRNYRDLIADFGLLTVSECDSEVLGLLIEQADGTLSGRCARAVRDTEGPLAMLGLWSRPASMIVARRGNPLHVGESAEGMYLATMRDGLPGRVTAVADNRVLQVSRRGGRIVSKTTKLPAPAAAALTPALPWWATAGSGEYRGG